MVHTDTETDIRFKKNATTQHFFEFLFVLSICEIGEN